VTLILAEHAPNHYSDAFALIIRNRPDALFVARHPANYASRQVIADFAIEQRIPGIYRDGNYYVRDLCSTLGTIVNASPSAIISAVMMHHCAGENEVIDGGVDSPFVFSVFIS
jgi:hypothetical protein